MERLEDGPALGPTENGRNEGDIDTHPEKTAFATCFWASFTVDELAHAQGVEPLTDVSRLFGTWPGTADDGFEGSIRALRQRETSGKDPA